jgi:predicted NAD/FAD-binding protein
MDMLPVPSVWDARSLSQVKQLDTANPVTSIELSRDGVWMTTCAGRDINFWDLNKCVPPNPHEVEKALT